MSTFLLDLGIESVIIDKLLRSMSEVEFCNLEPCLYPRNACRPNYMVSAVQQRFVCVPIQWNGVIELIIKKNVMKISLI